MRIADRLAEILRTEGRPRASRSFVIREALRRLNEDLLDKRIEDIFEYFVDREADRLRDARRGSESDDQVHRSTKEPVQPPAR